MVIVSHDRYLLDRVSTMVIGLDGKGEVGTFADYSQWEAWRSEPPPEKVEVREKASAPSGTEVRRKLPYIEQREWDGMEARILEAEQELAACDREVQEAASDAKRLPEAYAKLQNAQARVEELYARWAELEAKVPK
jgi:ATP-binding cassette subfamily F protein uup